MSSSSQRPTTPTNELAKERTRAAAERTLILWIQNCISLIGFGIALDRISNALAQAFPETNTGTHALLASIISLSAIAFGVFLIILAVIEYPMKVNALAQTDYLYRSLHSSRRLIIASIILFGLIALVVVLIDAFLVP